MATGISGVIQEKKQQIRDAWTLADAAVQWLSVIHARLEHLVELTKESGERTQYNRTVVQVQADGTGLADALFPGHQGWHYELVSITVTSAVGESGVALTYLNGPHPAGLLQATALGQFTSDQYPPGTYVPAGVGLDVQIRGGLAGGTYWVAILSKKLPQTEPCITYAGGEG